MKAALGLSLLLLALTPAGRAQILKPDLTINAAQLAASINFQVKKFHSSSCAVQEGCVTGPGKRKLMRFDVATPNIGDADLVLGYPASRPDLFGYSSCHGHYHFSGYALYELFNLSGTRLLTGRKQAFCLLDYTKVDPQAGPAKFTCSYQGISKGWSDVYGSYLDCQWLDITSVSPGQYILRVTINPEHRLDEKDYRNNSAQVQVTIPKLR